MAAKKDRKGLRIIIAVTVILSIAILLYFSGIFILKTILPYLEFSIRSLIRIPYPYSIMAKNKDRCFKINNGSFFFFNKFDILSQL